MHFTSILVTSKRLIHHTQSMHTYTTELCRFLETDPFWFPNSILRVCILLPLGWCIYIAVNHAGYLNFMALLLKNMDLPYFFTTLSVFSLAIPRTARISCCGVCSTTWLKRQPDINLTFQALTENRQTITSLWEANQPMMDKNSTKIKLCIITIKISGTQKTEVYSKLHVSN